MTSFTVLALCLGGAPAGANPVVEPVAADPSIVRAPDGRFYLYSTADDWGDGRGTRLMSIFTSFDLMDWQFVGTVFDQQPSWQPAGAGLWAPDIHRVDGRYELYYSLGGIDDPCIGLATAPTPTGPWTDLGRAVFCARDVNINGTIDPFVWSESGSKTMFVGNFQGIYAIPLDPTGAAPAAPPVLVADDRFEGAYVLRQGGYYYLFVSAGHCCRDANTAYRVLVGRSTSLTGPYLDRKGTPLTEGGGALILAGDDTWAGPGHNSVIADDAGSDWIVYHAIPRDNLRLDSGAQRREGMLDAIVWANGWPEIGDGSPSSTRPEVPELDLPVHVTLTRTSVSSVPANGGEIAATLRVEAPADRPYTGTVWASVTLPGGTSTAPITGPTPVDLAPGQVIEQPLVYPVPAAAGAGFYDVVAFAGEYPDQPVEFGVATAQKEGAGDDGGSGSAGSSGSSLPSWWPPSISAS